MSNKNIKDKAGDNGTISRREFIATTGIAATGLMAGACGKDENPVAPKDETPAVPQSKKVAVESLDNYNFNQLYYTIGKMFDNIGGIDDVIKKDSKVVIKLNLTGGEWAARKVQSDFGVAVEDSMWTHPRVIQAVGKLLLDAGVKEMILVDGQADLTGQPDFLYGPVFNSLGAEYINLNDPAPYDKFVSQSVGSDFYIYKAFQFNQVLTEADAFITLPKLKCHVSAGVTMSMKNHIGLVPAGLYALNGSGSRQALHGPGTDFSTRLPRVIVDLNRARPIHLSVVDGIKTAEAGEGNWVNGFNPIVANVLIVGKNPLATDVVSTAVMGFDPNAAGFHTPFDNSDNHLTLAAEKGFGTTNLDEIEVVGKSIDEVKVPFKPAMKTINANGQLMDPHFNPAPYGGLLPKQSTDFV